MNRLQKFLFETSFEAEDEAALKAGGGKQTPPAPSYTGRDLEQAREEGFARGRETGVESARAERDAEIKRSLAALGERLTQLAESADSAATRRGQDLLRLTVAMLQRLLPRLMAEHGVAEIEAVARDCFHRLRDEPRLVVRVADSLLDDVERRVTTLASRSGFEGRIVFLSQEDLRPGDVLVEWADGGAERNCGAIWKEIEVALSRALGGSAGPAVERSTATKVDSETDAVVSA